MCLCPVYPGQSFYYFFKGQTLNLCYLLNLFRCFSKKCSKIHLNSILRHIHLFFCISQFLTQYLCSLTKCNMKIRVFFFKGTSLKNYFKTISHLQKSYKYGSETFAYLSYLRVNLSPRAPLPPNTQDVFPSSQKQELFSCITIIQQ